ncbi:MAG: hypothetical protein IKA40_06265, partial [Clostridia bacterium]|nr:hypothetical protein [Clostridia bacterium]
MYYTKTHPKGCVCVVRTKGFAPLAARPATPLSMAYFAVKVIVIQSSQGKAFCSRKTAFLVQGAVCLAL